MKKPKIVSKENVQRFGHRAMYYPEQEILVIMTSDCCGYCEADEITDHRLHINVKPGDLFSYLPVEKYFYDYHRHGLITLEEKAKYTISKAEEEIEEYNRLIMVKQSIIKHQNNLIKED